MTVRRLPWDWPAEGDDTSASSAAFGVPVGVLGGVADVDARFVETGEIAENVSPIDSDGVDYSRFPVASEATAIEANLGPGDVLFIPSLWWHQRSTVAAEKADDAGGGGGDGGDDAEDAGTDDVDGGDVGITVEFQYQAHSLAMVRVAAALREQMLLE